MLVGSLTIWITAEFTRARFNHCIVPGQAVKQFTSTSCLHLRKELKLLYMQEQRYSANDHRTITTKVIWVAQFTV
jgi:hypothetical protein